MSENTFGFIFHPILIREHVNKKFPPLGTILPLSVINWACQYFPPQYISEITGITSQSTGEEIRGWFVAAPYTPQAMHDLPLEKVYRKIVDTINLAESKGARIMGLGAHIAVVGDAGKTIAERVSIPVTTGNSYTVSVAVDSMQEAARIMGTEMANAKVAVVGATGSIGKACARVFASDCAELILVGRDQAKTDAVRELCLGKHATVTATTNINTIYDADLVLTVSSAIDAIIEPRHLKPGSVVLDVARPRDVSPRVVAERDDVLVIEGGMVEVPGANVDFNFDFGFPPRKAFACMVETMALAMEQRYENFTIGRDISPAQVQEMRIMCAKHGFKLSGFRAFEHAVTQATIDTVRERAIANLKVWRPAIPV
ncbi:MAG: shikimate dehydrogenase [Chloroflexota bacterium]